MSATLVREARLIATAPAVCVRSARAVAGGDGVAAPLASDGPDVLASESHGWEVAEHGAGRAVRAKLVPLLLASEVESVRLEAGLVDREPRRLGRGLDRAEAVLVSTTCADTSNLSQRSTWKSSRAADCMLAYRGWR